MLSLIEALGRVLELQRQVFVKCNKQRSPRQSKLDGALLHMSPFSNGTMNWFLPRYFVLGSCSVQHHPFASMHKAAAAAVVQ